MRIAVVVDKIIAIHKPAAENRMLKHDAGVDDSNGNNGQAAAAPRKKPAAEGICVRVNVIITPGHEVVFIGILIRFHYNVRDNEQAGAVVIHPLECFFGFGRGSVLDQAAVAVALDMRDGAGIIGFALADNEQPCSAEGFIIGIADLSGILPVHFADRGGKGEQTVYLGSFPGGRLRRGGLGEEALLRGNKAEREYGGNKNCQQFFEFHDVLQ